MKWKSYVFIFTSPVGTIENDLRSLRQLQEFIPGEKNTYDIESRRDD